MFGTGVSPPSLHIRLTDTSGSFSYSGAVENTQPASHQDQRCCLDCSLLTTETCAVPSPFSHAKCVCVCVCVVTVCVVVDTCVWVHGPLQ